MGKLKSKIIEIEEFIDETGFNPNPIAMHLLAVGITKKFKVTLPFARDAINFYRREKDGAHQ